MSQKDDLISRQDAIDVFIKWFFDVFGIGRSDRMTTLLERLKEIPPAQPEIIYCKKCKHWTRTCGDEQWGLGDCDVFDKHLVMCNGYCAWAERRTDECTD